MGGALIGQALHKLTLEELGAARQAELFQKAKVHLKREALAPPGVTSAFQGRASVVGMASFKLHIHHAPNGKVFGWTETPFSSFLGPGYFEVVTDEKSGETWLDFSRAPAQSDVPADWPKVADNARAIGRILFGDTRVALRQSEGIFVGGVTRQGRDTGMYLAFRPVAPVTAGVPAGTGRAG